MVLLAHLGSAIYKLRKFEMCAGPYSWTRSNSNSTVTESNQAQGRFLLWYKCVLHMQPRKRLFYWAFGLFKEILKVNWVILKIKCRNLCVQMLAVCEVFRNVLTSLTCFSSGLSTKRTLRVKRHINSFSKENELTEANITF